MSRVQPPHMDFSDSRPMTAEERRVRFKKELHRQLINGMDLSRVGTMTQEQLRSEVRRVTEELCRQSPDLLGLAERERLVNDVLDETFGLGPLEALMRDTSISDILINGPKTIYVERRGKLELTNVTFHDDKHLLQIVQRIVGRVGRRVDETDPMVDARLPDGSRINAIIPPLALDGTIVSIRRFPEQPLRMADLVATRSMTENMVRFLAACVKARVSMLISGGTGAGKTTLLNALSAYIPQEERVATIEDSAELRLQQPHVVRMETRPPNVERRGEVTTRDLVRNALRMRPDRIVVGECRGPEALDMLQAMNTGHAGSLTTIHANDTVDALSRLEMMVGMAGFDLPIWIIRRQIASAITIVVQVARMHGGQRKVIRISEITGMHKDGIAMDDIFVFKQTGVDHEDTAQGEFLATGVRPKCLEKLELGGNRLPSDLFDPRVTSFYAANGNGVNR